MNPLKRAYRVQTNQMAQHPYRGVTPISSPPEPEPRRSALQIHARFLDNCQRDFPYCQYHIDNHLVNHLSDVQRHSDYQR